MSGCSVLRDGRSVLEEYGRDLDQLAEGDRVGIQRSSRGELHLWVNGQDCGAAASGLPPKLWAVVDLYGKCTQVTVVSCEPPPPCAEKETIEREEEVDDDDEEEEEEVVVCGVREDVGITALMNVAAMNGMMNGDEGRRQISISAVLFFQHVFWVLWFSPDVSLSLFSPRQCLSLAAVTADQTSSPTTWSLTRVRKSSSDQLVDAVQHHQY